MMRERLNPGDETRIALETILEGKLESQGDIAIYGKISGGVRAKGKVVVEKGAEVFSSLEGGEVRVAGYVLAKVKAKEKLEITSTGSIQGDVICPVLLVESGGVIQGQCNMAEKALGE